MTGSSRAPAASGAGSAAPPAVVVRSLLFNLLAAGATLLTLLGLWILLPLPRSAMQRVVRVWARVVWFLLRAVVGLGFEVRGLDKVPRGAAVLAAKHQSAWDTAVFFLLFDDPRYVLKRELLSIPLWGWYARKCGCIPVDRAGGAAALKAMAAGCDRALAEGAKLVIFPEGTRTAPGERRAYLPGVAALYLAGRAPVVPVAVNSGLFWGRRSFTKWPGVVTLEFLPEMPTGLDRKAFTAELERRIEAASQSLLEEARARFPYLPKPAPRVDFG
jgi:1-acyl-sn-glycerol-3-phosphate acyltransferase